jgi:hypothetical protein
MSFPPLILSRDSIAASVIRSPEYRSSKTNARSLTAFALSGYVLTALRIAAISSSVKGKTGGSVAWGGLIFDAGFSFTHPELKAYAKNVRNAFENDSSLGSHGCGNIRNLRSGRF